MYLEITVGAFLLCMLWTLYDYSKYRNAPPGPFRFPIIGNLIQLGLADPVPCVALHKLTSKYGHKLMSLKIGFTDSIVVANYEDLKDLSSRDYCMGRDITNMFDDRSIGKKGIAFSEGPNHFKLKEFMFGNLRDMGFGKSNQMENLITDELEDFVKYFRNLMTQNDGIICFDTLFQISMLNIIWNWLGATKLDYTDKKIVYMVESYEEWKKCGVFGAGLSVSFPFLRKVAPNIIGHNQFNQFHKDWHKFFNEVYEEYREKHLKTRDVSCYIDQFIEKAEESLDDPNTIFTVEWFTTSMLDVMQGAFATTSNVLRTLILFMIVNPDIQEKVHKEIDKVIGKEKAVELSDRINTHYINATILEALRWSRPVVNGIPRKTLKDFVYKGWLIKKNTELLPNLHTMNFEESIWGDPNVFRPERYLDASGRVAKEMASKVVAFGAGKRACPGEASARDEAYLYFTTFLQKFSFEIVPGEKPPSIEPIFGFNSEAVPFNARVESR